MNTGLPLAGAGANIPKTKLALSAQKARRTIPRRAEEIVITRKFKQL